jgi:acyl-CoA synthetase (NDP forming)
LAKGLSSLPAPLGNRLLIVESSGGLGTIACDLAEERGLVLPPLAALSQERLREKISGNMPFHNPLDLAAVEPDLYLLSAAALDMTQFDAVLLIFGDPVRDAARVVEEFRSRTDKPIVVAFSGGGEVEAAEVPKIVDLRVPVYPSVARAMKYLSIGKNKIRLKKRRSGETESRYL